MIDGEYIQVRKYYSVIASHLIALPGNKEMNKATTKMHNLAKFVPHHYKSVIVIYLFFFLMKS